MTEKRKLAAVMFTDIAGYTALMSKDEQKALALLRKNRELQQILAQKHNGEFLKEMGDGTLLCFQSALDAVHCAMEIQKSAKDNPDLNLRIGIHLGDIIYSDEEAFGDGITVARLIESQAVPGSILISNKIYEEVKNQPGIDCRYMKACDLDEEGLQIEVYTIANEGLVIPDLARSGSGPDSTGIRSGSRLRHFWEEARRRNVIRVVSFYAAGAYVALELSSIISDSLNLPEWIMIVIIVLLGALFILVAVWSWIYDITPEGIKKTPPAYVVEVPDRQEHAIEDADADLAGGKKSWFSRKKVFRRYLVPLFVLVLLLGFYFLKDRIFENWERVNKEAREHTEIAILYIKNQADPEIIKQELDLALEADSEYALALHTYAMVHRMEGDTILAKQKLHRIVASKPGYSKAWDLLASYAFWQDSFELAMGYSIRAIETDPGNTFAAYNMAIQSEDRGLNNQAVEWFRKAIVMDSSFTPGYSALGALYNKMNRPTEAILTLRKSLRISPSSMDNFRVYKNMAESHFLLEEYEKALAYLEQSKALNPDFPETEKCFARYYEASGDTESSVLHWRRYLALETDSIKLQETEQHLDSLRLHVPE